MNNAVSPHNKFKIYFTKYKNRTKYLTNSKRQNKISKGYKNNETVLRNNK